jgi:hypothetical protein
MAQTLDRDINQFGKSKNKNQGKDGVEGRKNGERKGNA